ncbi:EVOLUTIONARILY CONSERVED C-TERMINAL REGION 10 [Salix koriyanagi]|uniref:YTH domain-containing family protein n=1 Tax=Salix koriyanagi TaxID=2511006 RepID=A0A9Q0W1A9_9ROSI|nr:EVOLUTIONARILY CONSERVED C-TERMINAL REGION 10 [Salix koriyanagi]
MDENQHRLSPPPGESFTNRHNSAMDQSLSADDERIVSANPPSAESAIVKRPHSSLTPPPPPPPPDLSIIPPPQFNPYDYSSLDLAMPPPYGGYGNSTGVWDGYSQHHHLNAADGLHLSPVIYNDNQSLMFHSGYGFNPDMGYGQYSPVATPLTPLVLDGQLYSPQQIPFSPFYHPNMPSSGPPGSSEIMSSESNGDTSFFGPGSGYMVQYGSFGGGNVPGAPGSLTSASAYPQPVGILGPYEHHAAQGYQQRPLHGYGYTSTSSSGHYPHGGSYQSSGFGGGSISYAGANDRTRVGFDKGRRRERDQVSIYSSNDPLGFDRSRGPRASKLKGKNTTEHLSSSGKSEGNSASSGVQLDLYNMPDFVTDYENAKFFIIKSFSEDNVHKSIKYSIWASTPHGNKKIDAAYREAKEKEGNCPVFLLFSVNASGQFCGVAEMVGPVDFEKDADYWQQDRWNGQFPVQWHIIKDVPNSRFRHMLLENNDNKPVTHSRDSQEVKLEQGIEMLKIFKDYDAPTSIIDDFEFYDQSERASKERKAKQQPSLKVDGPGLLADDTINQMSDSFVQSLQLDDVNKELAAREEVASLRPGMEVWPANNCNTTGELANDSDIEVSKEEDSSNHNLSPDLSLKEGSHKYQD